MPGFKKVLLKLVHVVFKEFRSQISAVSYQQSAISYQPSAVSYLFIPYSGF